MIVTKSQPEYFISYFASLSFARFLCTSGVYLRVILFHLMCFTYQQCFFWLVLPKDDDYQPLVLVFYSNSLLHRNLYFQGKKSQNFYNLPSMKSFNLCFVEKYLTTNNISSVTIIFE